MLKIKISALLLIFLVIGCNSNTAVEDSKESITISGTIENNNGTILTDSMSIYVFWTVSSGSPDYTYVWGKGTIDKNNMTFKVDLTEMPPNEALNSEVLGVGLISIINDNNLQNGKLPTGYPIEKLIGVAGWYSIIYKANNSLDSINNWFDRFNKGYDAGIGVEEEGIFDSFKPTDKNLIKIIIDDLQNIPIVNWT